MQDSGWLRLVTVGLILAALAIGYFLLGGKFISGNTSQKVSQTNKTMASASPSAIPAAAVLGPNVQTVPNSSPKTASISVDEKATSRNQNQVKILPKTGFPEVMVGIFSIGIMITGLGLRRFPH